jgi:hypothetical protein
MVWCPVGAFVFGGIDAGGIAVSLVLGGKKIIGHDIKLSATLPISTEDISGQSSYSDSAETGDKPKQLAVNMMIKFDQMSALSDLVTLAEAKDEIGRRSTYGIQNQTAEGMRIRLVKFQGDMTVREDESLKLWRIAFRLSEVRSVPELVESRQQSQPVTADTATGDVVSADAEEIPEGEVTLSGFERVLKRLDERLAKNDEAVSSEA